jgi:hypothetical protein
MVIVVCGDSFCAASNDSRDHFSHQLQDDHGHEVINVARGGMSNVGICFQIQYAVSLRPHIIIFNRTYNDRVDLVMPGRKFKPQNGLKNFIYAYPAESTYGKSCVGDVTAPIFSTVWQGLDQSRYVPITSEQITAVNLYLKYLFDNEMKDELDSWMFDYWISQIEKQGIIAIEIVKTGIGKIIYDFAYANPKYPSVFHTDRQTQTLLTHALQQHISKG